MDEDRESASVRWMFSSPGMPNTQVTPSCSRHWTRSSAARRRPSVTAPIVVILGGVSKRRGLKAAGPVLPRCHLTVLTRLRHFAVAPEDAGALGGQACFASLLRRLRARAYGRAMTTGE